MIVFAAFTPHSPLLLPSIGKEHLAKLEKTTSAIQHLKEDLYAAHPDTIVILSSHADHHEKAFSLNVHDAYSTDFSEFGDPALQRVFRPDMHLIDHIQRGLRRNDIPLSLYSDETLDFGAAVPLTLLTDETLDARIIPLSYSGMDARTHLRLGKELKEVLQHSTNRIALIGSGDLSHCLTSDSPAGLHPAGDQFDAMVQTSIQKMSATKLVNFDKETIDNAEQCAYEPLLMLLGALDGIQTDPEILSYEYPFGVGYLVAEFHLH